MTRVTFFCRAWCRRAASGRRLVVVSGVVGASLLAGCATETTPADTRAPTSDVGQMEAWRDAEMITGLSRDRFTLIGSGDSMLPVYGENTMLVITKIDYNALQPGMQVAYNSRSGQRVLHVLVEKDSRGWIVKGLNNEVEDRERVTPANLIGIVYASFSTDPTKKK